MSVQSDLTAQLFFMTWHTLPWQVGVHGVLLLLLNPFNSNISQPFPFCLLSTLFVSDPEISSIFCILITFFSVFSCPKPQAQRAASKKTPLPPLLFIFQRLHPSQQPPTHHHLSIFFLSSLPNHSSLSLCEEYWRGEVERDSPSPAGLFVLTCTCRMSGGMTQTGYPTLVTTIYTQTRPEPNTILPGKRGGADGNERQREKNS